MSVITHGSERPLDRAERRSQMATARKDQLKQIGLSALVVLSMGSVLTALIALRTAVYVWPLLP